MIMAKPINIDIMSKRSIDAAIKQLEQYTNSVEYKAKLLAEKLSERGVEIARVQIAELDAIFRSELISSLHNAYEGSFKGGAVYAVIAGSDHAFFVEFGTGVVGKQSPYKGKLPDGVTWEYATGKTIHQLADGRIGWFFPLDGEWYFTEGMPSRPFMYNTANELRKIVKEVAQEVFNQ